MKKTIYVKNKVVWRQSVQSARRAGMSHSEYIETALLMFMKYGVTSKRELTLTLKAVRA